MKILLLGFAQIAYMPYVNFYLDALKERNDIDFELIYWNRDGKPDTTVPTQIKASYEFKAYLLDQVPFKKKLRYFRQYRQFALKIMRKTLYDRIIVLPVTPGLTVMDYLIIKYKGRYIVDFRDITYEYIPIYRKLVGWLVRFSELTFVSSNAFRKFLPEMGNIFTVHNYLQDSLDHQMIRKTMPREREVLRIAFWGLVRQAEPNKKLIDALGNDPRFELHYYGRMQQAGRDMEEYAHSKKYSNVHFHGAYMPAERYEFAGKTDLLHNVYDLGYTMSNAMGNKYYDGIIFGIPQICTRGSYMETAVMESNVGLAIDLDAPDIADKLWTYYQGIDWTVFEQNCRNALQAVLDEQAEAKKKLLEIF